MSLGTVIISAESGLMFKNQDIALVSPFTPQRVARTVVSEFWFILTTALIAALATTLSLKSPSDTVNISFPPGFCRNSSRGLATPAITVPPPFISIMSPALDNVVWVVTHLDAKVTSV